MNDPAFMQYFLGIPLIDFLCIFPAYSKYLHYICKCHTKRCVIKLNYWWVSGSTIKKMFIKTIRKIFTCKFPHAIQHCRLDCANTVYLLSIIMNNLDVNRIKCKGAALFVQYLAEGNITI